MVPKVVHQVWLGGGPLPPILGAFVDSARWVCERLGWTHQVWTEGLLHPRFFPEWSNLAVKCCHLSQQSNVARYLVLRECGGLYLDVDVELFDLPEDLHGSWIAGLSECPGPGLVNPCVLASEPGGGYVSRMLAGIESSAVDLGVHMSAGPALASAELGVDVNLWTARVWHGLRGDPMAYGHHYGWGPRLRSFLKSGGMPPTLTIS